MVARLDNSVIGALQDLLLLLQKEREEEFRQYHHFIGATQPPQRVHAGLCWFPLDIRETGYGLGDYPYIVVRRTGHRQQPHQFQGGRQVRLFRDADDNDFLNGTLHYVDGDEMKIFFYVDELPDWVDQGRIGVDLLFDERSFREMEKAVQTVLNSKNCRLTELANILYGKAPARFGREPVAPREWLNESQQEAVTRILNAEDLACVHGPPGTGKTTTLVAAIHGIVEQEGQVLVCTPSNAAADHIALQLLDQGIRVLRIGNITRIHDKILSCTIEGLLENHSRFDELCDYKKRSQEMRRMAGKYKRNFGPEERKQRDLLYREARSLSQEARLLEDYMVGDLVRMASVVVTTLVGVESKYLEDHRFHTVIIDEAAQALEPATWIPVLRAHRVIMAGDPYQLPPTIKSAEGQKGGLAVTLLEKCLRSQPEAVQLLTVQYRMNDIIMQFSNSRFYEGRLLSHPTVADRKLPVAEPFDQPLEFVDTAGCGFDEKVNPESQSLYNEGEIRVIMTHLEQLLPALPPDKPQRIAIISPYREQVEKLEERLKGLAEYKDRVDINTVDAFQGQERDIIYISMVRSNENGVIGFLQDYRRMNVAMTRAKKKLVVVGDSATLGYDAFYRHFLEYCEQHAVYGSAWSYMTE